MQTGKSNMLNMVLPAVLRRHQNFGVGGDNELLICRLDFDDIATGQTYSHALRRFATALLNWAAGGEVIPSSLTVPICHPLATVRVPRNCAFA